MEEQSELSQDRARYRHCLVVALSDEQYAAAEAWRSANGFNDPSEALGELVRLGLLSEIARIYRHV